MNLPTQTMEPSTYLFDNAHTEAALRLEALSSIFDPGTIRHLESLRISPGWQCLEVGAGNGSVASWLCRQVGAPGHVVATDIDTRFLNTLNLPNLEVWRHDIRHQPLPVSRFDLVHTRLVLMHLPNRSEILGHLIASLKPGGWLVVEEFDCLTLLADPSVCPHETRLRTSAALLEIMARRGVDLRFGRLLHHELCARKLSHVSAEGTAFAVRGGSTGSNLIKASYQQLRNSILGSGLVSETEFEQDSLCIDRKDFFAPSPMMWSAWGQAQ